MTTTLHFETLSFQAKEPFLEITLLNIFRAKIPLAEMPVFDLPDVHTIKTEEKKFSALLSKYLDQLRNKLTDNPAAYIHKNSGIPLMGNVAFGIVYRNSSIIEIKPVTSCNLDCVYCSISEGLSSKKHDFVVEKEYLLAELQKLIDYVDESVEVHIGVQGEPFLYADLEGLFTDLEQMPLVHTVSIDTNGTFLSKERIDRLSVFTKLQLNLSLDALGPEIAKVMAGTKAYNVEKVKEVIAYAAQKMPRRPFVAPVLTSGYNEAEMEKIIRWISTLDPQPKLGIQNFLHYKTGRRPAEEIAWPDFYQNLEAWEQQYGIKLRWSKEDFKVRETRELEKPFQVGEVVKAVIKCPDRFPGSVLAAAKDRTISVPNCVFKADKSIKVEITRDKHNIFVGKLVK